MFFGTWNSGRRGSTRGDIYRTVYVAGNTVYGAEWDTYIRGISPLWQPLTYFLPYVLPYNSGANIITYGRKSNAEREEVAEKDETPD